jgi:hypothetical protein
MRNVKELLKVMLENQNLFKHGLCLWSKSICWEGLISINERNLLLDYIKKNKPSMFSSIDSFVQRITLEPYYWTVKDINQRVKWINEQIEKL